MKAIFIYVGRAFIVKKLPVLNIIDKTKRELVSLLFSPLVRCDFFITKHHRAWLFHATSALPRLHCSSTPSLHLDASSALPHLRSSTTLLLFHTPSAQRRELPYSRHATFWCIHATSSPQHSCLLAHHAMSPAKSRQGTSSSVHATNPDKSRHATSSSVYPAHLAKSRHVLIRSPYKPTPHSQLNHVKLHTHSSAPYTQLNHAMPHPHPYTLLTRLNHVTPHPHPFTSQNQLNHIAL